MEELALKIDTLTQLYTQIESHLSDSITWFLTVFFGAITVIVLALVFLVKTSIQRGVDKASNGLDEKLDKLQGQIDESIQKQKAFDSFYEGYRIIDGEREYFAPPMTLGIPYRTTEKFFGNRPVYTILVAIGALPDQSQKTIDCSLEDVDVDVVVRSSVICSGTNDISLQRVEPCNGGIRTTIKNEKHYLNAEDIPHAYVQVWYTRSTRKETEK